MDWRKAVSRPKPGRSWSMRPPAAIHASRRGRFSPASGARTSGMVPLDEAPGECGRTRSKELIEQDLAAGLRPCAIAAVVRRAPRPRRSTRYARSPTIARRYGLWLHVDAAMAGSAMILPECRWMWDGIESADSVVINAHKWLGAPFDCSLYYVRDEQHLLRVMSTNPSFLQSSVDSQVRNLRDTGHPARPALPCAQALVPDPRAGGLRATGPAAARHRERQPPGRDNRRDAWLEGGGAGSSANGVHQA